MSYHYVDLAMRDVGGHHSPATIFNQALSGFAPMGITL